MEYRISGVWKDGDTITHYAFHRMTGNIAALPTKVTKARAIELVEDTANTVSTRVWNYSQTNWYIGESVHIVGTGADRYLRSNPDNRLTDNLGHLINYGTIF